MRMGGQVVEKTEKTEGTEIAIDDNPLDTGTPGQFDQPVQDEVNLTMGQ
jgi:hypothetical protein